MRTCPRHFRIALAAALFASAACSDASAPEPPRTLSLSVSAVPEDPVAAVTSPEPTPAGLEQRDSTHTLVISSIQLVVRRIGLARADSVCSEGEEDDEHDEEWEHDDDCEALKLGPILVDVPLDGDVEPVFAVELPEGTYRGVELQIHKPSLGNPSDLEFLRHNPLLEGVSILVRGTYDGEPFTFVQRLEAKQRYALDPPLTVTADSEPMNLTVHVDVSTWFVTRDGKLVDPVSANRGGPYEEVVRRNILKSLDAFKDDDHDGECDDDERWRKGG